MCCRNGAALGVVGRPWFRRVPGLPRPPPRTRGRRGRRLVHRLHRRTRPRRALRSGAGGLGSLGAGALACVVLLARRGDERGAFIVSIAAALALTPIVWLHYFALLAVVVALAQSRLGLVWFVPLGMVLTPGSGQPTPFETSWTLAVAALTIALALRASSHAGSCDPTGRAWRPRREHRVNGASAEGVGSPRADPEFVSGESSPASAIAPGR